MLDFGVDLIQFATLIAPKTRPTRIVAQGLLCSSGVDVETSFSFQVIIIYMHTYFNLMLNNKKSLNKYLNVISYNLIMYFL